MTNDKEDINYQICRDAKAVLLENGFEVIELTMTYEMGYMNFYIGSGGDTIYLPVTGEKELDEPVIREMGKYFDKVVPVIFTAFAAQGGGIHCQTQQIPVGK